MNGERFDLSGLASTVYCDRIYSKLCSIWRRVECFVFVVLARLHLSSWIIVGTKRLRI